MIQEQILITEPDIRANQMLNFLRTRLVRRAKSPVGVDTPLVTSGLIDSFALIEVLMKLESITDRKIPASRVKPAELDTVSKMLALAERIGKPR